jgi:hypothetical protein
MSEPLPSRIKELRAVSIQKHQVAVGLLRGHTKLRAYMFNLGHTQRQDCRLCRDEKEDTSSVRIIGHCPALACKRYRILGLMFLKTEDLENLRVNVLISLLDNTSFGIIVEHHFKKARR